MMMDNVWRKGAESQSSWVGVQLTSSLLLFAVHTRQAEEEGQNAGSAVLGAPKETISGLGAGGGWWERKSQQ